MFVAERLAKIDRQLEARRNSDRRDECSKDAGLYYYPQSFGRAADAKEITWRPIACTAHSWISDRDIIQDRWRNKMGVCDARTAQRRADRRSSWRKSSHELKLMEGTIITNRPLTLAGNYLCMSLISPARPGALTWYQTKFTSFFLIYRTQARQGSSKPQCNVQLLSEGPMFLNGQLKLHSGGAKTRFTFACRRWQTFSSLEMLRCPLKYLLFQCTLAEHHMYHVAIPSKTSFFGTWQTDYPGSGGGPNTSRPRAIFTTIVQL
ncbi:unnamed protein product [Fusarium venenatum]|uniref:Uncharacterized protein n=1 Tax=Fusarium venenatum TaxID=56646 RepID=A0A2L2TRH3_9HYPO|nr:uncharacterized protein FVRRES_08748 [Fusarium venenatum]CEI68671.1 unnamed protein product [Fusarium venenatum]